METQGDPVKRVTEREDLFGKRPEEKSFPTAAVAIASVAVLILVGVLVMLGRRPAPAPNTPLPLAAYAANLGITDIQMSESSSLAGGKSTYIDGHITNHGQATVTGIQVQVLFANSEALPPQIETLPLSLIRTHEPYVDTEPVSADPLTPGAEREFRLIFENIGANWNQTLPEIHVTAVQKR